jgi:signal transduction histidine kinase
VDQALSRMLLGILLTGLAVAGVAVLWVLFVLRGGLAPLRRIADEVAAIDTGSLSGRIGDDDLPDELAPIVSRLNELMARLETSFTRERRFSSDLAHEMRTPVAELRLLAESAVKWPDEGGREAWEAVIGSVDRMELVVQAMLQLARLEQASPGRLGESLALSPLALESWAAHHTRATARGITLRLDIEPDATVTGDPALWRHILGNLLGNAADYADEGSEVVLSTERTMTQNGLVVCVANSSTALAPGDIDRLFDRFWRGDTARAESSHCGLGLPLARACGEAMGWRLRALQRPEDGWLEMRIEPED